MHLQGASCQPICVPPMRGCDRSHRVGRYRAKGVIAATARLCAFALSALLAGCAASALPDLKAPVPDAWRNGSVVAPAVATRASGVWWRVFNDPELSDLVARALHGNLGLAQAAERLRAARALAGASRAPYLPVLKVGTDRVVEPDRARSYFLAGFDAGWELPLFGAGTGAARVAHSATDEALAEWQGARISLVAEVVRCWIDLRAAQQRVHGLAALHDDAARRLQLVQKRIQLQLAPAAELHTAEAAVARRDAALAKARPAVGESAQQLALLLGLNEPDPAWLAVQPLPRLAVPPLASVPADLLRNQPQIARAEAQVVRAAGELDISRADLYPHIGLGASLQWALDTTDARMRSHGTIFSLGPIVHIPLFDWGLRQAQKRADGHRLEAAVLAYREAVLKGVADTEIALGNLRESELREAATEQALRATRQAQRAVETRQSLQLADQLDVLAARAASVQAGLDALAAQRERDLAYVALYKALGGPPVDPDQLATSHEPVAAGAR